MSIGPEEKALQKQIYDARMSETYEKALQKQVYDALRSFQDALQTYRQITKRPPIFLIDRLPEIPAELLAGCTVLPRRENIISSLHKGGVGVEVGTETGRFARTIMALAKPKKLYLLDISYTRFQRVYVEKELADGSVVTKEGYSWDLLAEFDDEYFDFIYVDADHGYDGVRKDLDVSIRKVKKGGHIICNDFAVWHPPSATPWGVPKAVTELIIAHKCPVSHLAFHPYGYNDIAFRRP